MLRSLDALTALATPEDAAACVRLVGRALGADRCFLYLRDPDTACGTVVATWRRAAETPDLPEHDYFPWGPEPAALHETDPMFTAALAGRAATVVPDIETAGGLVDVEFERGFRHRALVHVNLNADGRLWGVLQPAMSATPRAWSAEDEAFCLAARARLTPLARAAVALGAWPAPARRLVEPGDHP